jgi:hypothetical protein
MNVRELLIEKLREIGADGLYNEDGECGCGLDDMEPCAGYCNLSICEAAVKRGDLFYPMEGGKKE